MSFLLLLNEKDTAGIMSQLSKFETEIDRAEPLFKIEGMRLELICRDLPHHICRYKQLLQEAKAFEDWLTSKRDKTDSKLWKQYNEKYTRSLTTRDIQAYIGGEPEHVAWTELILEATHAKNKLGAICDAFEAMHWMAGNMVKLRVAEVQDAIV